MSSKSKRKQKHGRKSRSRSEATQQRRPPADKPQAANQSPSDTSRRPQNGPSRLALRRSKLSLRVKLLFSLVTTVAVFVLLEVALVALGVQPVSYREDPYVGFASRIPLFVEHRESDGNVSLVTAENKLRLFNRQRFPKEKPVGAYRVFCLGGSTTYGRPYEDTTSFCGWLRAFLPKADPSRQWELINAGGISYASYRVAMVAEELVRYEPDLLIIYAGQNEFLERRTYGRLINTPRAVSEVGALLARTRTYSAVKRGMDSLTERTPETATKRFVLPGEVEAILDDSVGLEEYHRDNKFRQQVIDHYRHNLSRIVEIARSGGAAVVLVNPASNLRDCSPFKSEHRDGLSDREQQRWQSLFDRAREAQTKGEWKEVLAALDQAALIDNRYAKSHYLRGQVLCELGRYEEAKAAFALARDEDVCPLRALGMMRKIVAEVASDWEVPLVDFVTLVETQSAHGIPGDNLFLDHVHPTIEGNQLLARSILDEMIRQQIVHPTAGWGEAVIRQVTKRVEGTLDLHSHGVALRNLSKVLAWAGKHEEAGRLAKKATELNPGDAEAYFQIGGSAARLGQIEQAEAAYRRALELRPSYSRARVNLGLLAQRRGQTETAIESFRRAIAADANDYKAHLSLAVALLKRRQLQPAAEHCRLAIELQPRCHEAHVVRATALVHLGRVREAAGHLEKAIELEPGNAETHHRLGGLQAALGDYREALRLFRRAVELDAGHAEAKDSLAWLLATAPDAKVRDGAEAVRLAKQLCEDNGFKDPATLRSLAVAEAETGQFDQAAATARQAIRLAESAGHQALANDIRARLQFFVSHRPCREGTAVR